VREAFDYALNREAIAKVAEGGWGGPAYEMAPPGNAAHIPDLVGKRKYNVAKAKELLQQAGYPNGFATVLNAATMADQNFLAAVQANAADAGITMKIERVAGGPFFEMGWQKGWEGLFVLTCTSNLNYAQSLSTQLGPAAGGMQTFYSTKRPDGLYTPWLTQRCRPGKWNRPKCRH
jgi:ABC-type transport system substrate-binding protein